MLLTRCAEIDGLFVDVPERERERFTLLGCRPADALAGWLGPLSITAPGTPDFFGEDLIDVTVLGRRPSTTVPGTVDVDLDGFVFVYEPTDAVERPAGVDEFVLVGGDDTELGTCADVTGVFREQGPPPVPVVRLLGCEPTDALLTAGHIRADVEALLAGGTTLQLIEGIVHGYVKERTPSTLGAGLLDVVLDSCPVTPLPTGYLDVLAHWRGGRPAEKNTWAGFDDVLRHHWAGLAMSARREPGTNRPAGGVPSGRQPCHRRQRVLLPRQRQRARLPQRPQPGGKPEGGPQATLELMSCSPGYGHPA